MNFRFICAAVAAAVASATASGQTVRQVSVDELFTLVESGSSVLKKQMAEAEVAAKAVDEAKSRRLPDISAALAVSYSGNVIMTDRDLSHARGLRQPHVGNSFAIEAEQAVYAGGAIEAGVSIAALQKEMADTGVDMTRDGQRFTALGMYLDLYKIDNRITVYKNNISLTERLIADIKAKRQQGMALPNDITRYELQMENLKLGLRRLEDARAVANHRLCNAVGLESDVTVMPDPDVVSHAVDNASEQNWQDRAAAASPRLKNSELGVSLARQQLRLAKSDMLPKVSVFATESFSGPFTYDIPPINKNFNVWTVGIGVRYSISSLFKGNKTVRRAKAAITGSEAEQEVTAVAVNDDMQEAYTMYRQSLAELGTKRKSVELATQNYGVVSERYLEGLALITDMTDASNVKLDAELQEADARAEIVYAYYKMKYIAGEI